ncbi:MAG: hypothetical protein IJ968_04950 [Clostridia bacterium]|nr:hypothetical protein [Clostridia bacterium]
MKQNRKWILILSIVLSVAIAAGGTMAYLQDTDEDVNVMTLGNVYIDQIEKERIEQSDDNTSPENVKDFEDDKPLYPYVGELDWADEYQNWETGGANQLFTDEVKNVVDKFVFVENTGNSDAYVRTWFAFEQGDYTEAELDKLLGININKTYWAFETVANNVEIEGGKYQIVVATYLGNVGADKSEHPNGMLPAGETTRPSLLQVYLDKTAGNEEVENLDSNGNGKYDILVVSQAVQAAGFADAETALNAAFTNGAEPVSFALYETEAKGWFKEATEKQAAEEEAKLGDHWDGTVDTSWYNDADTEFVLTTAEQLAGFAELVDGGNTFEGKTVKLGNDICLGCTTGECANKDGEPIPFDPIGSYRNDKPFKGTFDGQGQTIENLSQNTWALDNGYYYTDCGLGLFGAVEDGTVKNLVIDAAEVSGESAICGAVAAVAEDATFENITIKNSNVADYQYYAGGIVGWASGDTQFIGCNLDASTTVGSQWGDFNNANGGVIGGVGSNANILMKDCTVACRIDAHNDVVSAYEWYSYRRSGMLIGDTGVTEEPDKAVSNAAAPQLTCENVTVIYGDWANYTYCQFNAMSYPWVRVQGGTSVDAYTNVRYGHPTDADGNEVVDDNHKHNDGEKHHELIVFDQLYGGESGDRYCTYGTATHDGVTVVYDNK